MSTLSEQKFDLGRREAGIWRRAARAALLASALIATPAAAQDTKADLSDALIELFTRAQDGSGDPHLPSVLNDLKKALASQNLLAFLKLVDPAYFSEQFQALHRVDRSPGDTLDQFSCEFFQICDISKSYAYTDIVSAQVLSARPAPGATGGVVEVRLELRMWDGLTLTSTIFYDPANARLSSARG